MRGEATQGRKRIHLLSDMMKACDTQKNNRRQQRVAEIEKSWKSYTCFSPDYLK